MFTSSELTDIKRRMEAGETQESLAASFKLSIPAFRDRLSRSGWRTRSTIIPIHPVAIESGDYALAK